MRETPMKPASPGTATLLRRLGLPTDRMPPTPGEILNEEFRKPLGLTQEQLAERLHTTVQSVNRIIRGKQAISPEMAIKLSEAFGTTAHLWLALQADHDLARAASRTYVER